MTKQEVLKCLALIESIYSFCLAKNETVAFWLEVCDQVDYKKVMVNLQDHIRKSPYPPSFADLAVIADKKKQMADFAFRKCEWTNQYTPKRF